jgi:hypothetical protein
MVFVDLFNGLLGRRSSSKRLSDTLASDLPVKADLWMANAIGLSAMAILFAAAPGDRGDTARAKVTQGQELA